MKSSTLVFLLLIAVFSSFSQSNEKGKLRIQLIMSKEDTTKIRLLNELAEATLTNNVIQAKIHLDVAQVLLDKHDIPQLKARTLTNLGVYFILENKIDSAKHTIQRVLELAPKLPNSTYVIAAINHMGDVHYQRKEYTQAIYYYELLLSKEHLLDPVQKFELHNNLAKVQRALGNFVEAMNFYLKALKVYNDKSLTLESKVISLHEIGALHAFLDDTVKALDYFRRSLALSYEKGSILYMALNMEEIGKLSLAKGEYNRAMHSLSKALELYSDINYEKGIASTFYKVGLISYHKDDLSDAASKVNASMELAIENDFKNILGSNLNLMANIAYKKAQFEEATNYAKEGLALAQRIQAKDLMKEASHILLISNERLGDLEQAVYYAKLYAAYKDSLVNEGDLRKQEALKFNYELQRQEETKQAELAIKDAEISQQSLIIAFMITIALLLVLLTFLLVRGNRLLRVQKKELVRQHEAVASLNHLKDKLFSIISHDLKSPLLSLRELALIYKHRKWTEQQLNQFFAIFFQQFEQTIDLLENLLNWTKSQMGGMNITPVKFNLTELVDSEIDILYSSATRKGIQLQHSITQPIYLFSDLQMVHSVLRNLLHNAIKFCDKGDEIWVNVKVQEDVVQLFIVDTGVGMDEKTKKNLFKLEKYTTPGTKLETGTGLGLIICKEFITQLGGKIWAESKLGEGSVFCVILPLSTQNVNNKPFMLPKEIKH